jgi:hypothetical protein
MPYIRLCGRGRIDSQRMRHLCHLVLGLFRYRLFFRCLTSMTIARGLLRGLNFRGDNHRVGVLAWNSLRRAGSRALRASCELQEVVHSVLTGNADVAKPQRLGGGPNVSRFDGAQAYQWALRIEDNKDGPELLSSVNPTFTWVRLAQRMPVRVHITHVPPGVLVSAGLTCTVVNKGRRGTSNRARHEESHDCNFWSTFELVSRLLGCWTCPNGCSPLPTR